MVRPALQGASLIGKQGMLHTFIRPVVEAGQLLVLMKFRTEGESRNGSRGCSGAFPALSV